MSRDYVVHPFRAAVNLQIDYAQELNPQQLAAVTAAPGPALVIAGAGAGKTRTLTYRVAYLLEQGIPAPRILLLTFTNKAAREMMRRVNDLLGGDLTELWGGTFHSIGHRILRANAELVGYRRDFTILDREDAKDLLKTCVAEAEIDTTKTRFPKADVLGDIFSLAVNTQKSIPETLARQYSYFNQLASQVEDLARRYQARKQSANVMDFDDLLVLWLRLLEEQAAVREQLQRKFQFILVDEYQDTNKIQGDLIDLLAARHHNVMVVGDDSQSIYSWRGANFRNILDFPKRHPGARVYKIETNYRSTPEILEVANSAIRQNVNQFAKELAPLRKNGLKPALVTCADAGEQAVFVAQRLLELREEGVGLQNMAVLYRSHFHALELQLELTRRNIPFTITSGVRFFEQAHLKDLSAHLKFVCNPSDELAFKRMVRLLPGIGGKGADRLWAKFRQEHLEARTIAKESKAGKTAADAVLEANPAGALARQDPPLERQPIGATKSPHLLAAALQACAPAAPRKAAKAWAQLAITISQLEEPAKRRDPAGMIRIVVEAGYEDYLKETYTNYRSRLEDLEQLANFAVPFDSIEEFLTQLALLTNLEAEEEQPARDNDDERVKLSTIHQAKGLEFDVVFVIMLCDGLFPSHRSLDEANPEAEEEERRLFYVAITRARNELYLSYPLMRFTASQSGDYLQQRSRFLDEIPAGLLDEWNLKSPGFYR